MTSVLVEKSGLDKALSSVRSIVERKAKIPILQNILLECVDSDLRITATDLDQMLVSKTPADIMDDGFSTTVPAEQFCATIGNMPKGCEIKLSVAEGEHFIRIETTSSKTRLPTLPASDFPTMSRAEKTTEFILPANEVGELLKPVQFAVSTEVDRPAITGVYFHLDESMLTAVATDGKKMVRKTLGYLPKSADDLPGVIISLKAMKTIITLTSATEQEIRFKVSSALFSISNLQFEFTTRLLDFEYPDYHRMIPEDSPQKFKINATGTASALNQVMVVIDSNQQPLRCVFSAKGLAIDTANNTGAAASSKTECTQLAGEDDVTVGIFGKNFVDALAQVPDATLVVHLGEASTAIKILSEEDENILFLVMPVHLGNFGFSEDGS